MNDLFSSDTDCGDFLKTEFDNEKIFNNWNSDKYFFCTLRMTSADKIIITNANRSYFRLINRKCNFCGKEIYSFLSRKYADFISDMFSCSKTDNRIFRYIRESTRSEDLWFVTAVYTNGRIKFMGKLVNDLSRFDTYGKQGGSIGRNDADTDFIGTIIVSAENNDFIAEVCSDSILSLLPNFCGKFSLKKAAEKYMNINSSLNLLRKSIKQNIPITYYDLSSAEADSVPRVYRFSIIPAASAMGVMAAITVCRTRSSLSEPCRSVIGSAFCEICRTDSGNVYIKNMNSAFSELLSSDEIIYSEICTEDFFSELEKSCGSSLKMNICGKGGSVYRLRAYPKTDGTAIESLLIIINVVPKANIMSSLSPRESEALSLAAEGYPNKYIAHVLDISEGTVKKFIHNGYAKLGISSRVELVKLFGTQAQTEEKAPKSKTDANTP